ncbi:MAG: FtsW/RodA/SpoVE family cell cycle protein [Oscillospiraceae bacterium]|nr:FtsW/RodA/SpoVE family cell cycle protein [Oscillospiraceae bacterium]
MLNAIKKFFYRTDWVLLGLCLAASIFGIVMIASASNYHGASTYVSKQIIALVIGLILFVVLSFLDIKILAEHQTLLVIFSAVFLAMLYPFGVEGDTGNRSWMSIPGMPFMIQPAEYCKIIYIIVCARIMTIYQEHINSLPCVLRLGFVSAVFMGLIVVISKDAGVALIYVFTLIIMALAGGFSFIWFAAAGAGLAVIVPILWNSSLVREDQKNRVMVLFDESIDPLGTTVRYQASRSINAISGGGLTGQGLFQGTQIQSGNVPAQHTDFIFAAIGEELGYAGCALCIGLLVAIILRILYVGAHSQSYFYRQVCVGIAGTLMFQIIINIGMCLGVAPVIGLTLPFFSYGGSSMMSLFIAMGVISSVRMHPSPDSQQRYLRLPV